MNKGDCVWGLLLAPVPMLLSNDWAGAPVANRMVFLLQSMNSIVLYEQNWRVMSCLCGFWLEAFVLAGDKLEGPHSPPQLLRTSTGDSRKFASSAYAENLHSLWWIFPQKLLQFCILALPPRQTERKGHRGGSTHQVRSELRKIYPQSFEEKLFYIIDNSRCIMLRRGYWRGSAPFPQQRSGTVLMVGLVCGVRGIGITGLLIFVINNE